MSAGLAEIVGMTDNPAGDQHSHPTPGPGETLGGITLIGADVDWSDIKSTELGRPYNRTIIDGPTGRLVSLDGRPGSMQQTDGGGWQRNPSDSGQSTARVIGRVDPIPYVGP